MYLYIHISIFPNIYICEYIYVYLEMNAQIEPQTGYNQLIKLLTGTRRNPEAEVTPTDSYLRISVPSVEMSELNDLEANGFEVMFIASDLGFRSRIIIGVRKK
jgi:hypothetical protein